MTARDAPTAGLGLHTGLGVKRDERDGHRQWAGVGSNPDVWLLGQATVEGDPGGQGFNFNLQNVSTEFVLERLD
jgi:hypothetical protein